MAMIDFQKEAKQPNYRIEHDVERLIFKEVLKLALDDSNSEVKNMSVQWWVLDPFGIGSKQTSLTRIGFVLDTCVLIA